MNGQKTLTKIRNDVIFITMTKQELTDFFMTEFWPRYRELVRTPFPTKWKGGARGDALKKWLSLKPSEELRGRIIAALDAQIAHRRKLFQKCGSMEAYLKVTEGQKFYCNRMGSTWLNQMGWEDEIPSIGEDEQAQPGVTCSCGNPVMGPRFSHCERCYPETTGMSEVMKQWMKDNGLWKRKDEDVHQWRMRCREVGKELLRRRNGRSLDSEVDVVSGPEDSPF